MIDYSKNIVARPRKETKPTTSVTVVTITLPAIAGSWFSLLKIIGTNTPATTELKRLMIIAAAISNARTN